MNRIYQVIWNDAKGKYVVVSEFAKRHAKRPQMKKIVAAFIAAGILAGVGTNAFAAAGYTINASGGDANGADSVLISGTRNYANGIQTVVVSGQDNTVSGQYSVSLGGCRTTVNALNATAIGGYESKIYGDNSIGILGSTGSDAHGSISVGFGSYITVANTVAIGRLATTDEDGTIAFGHDMGDKHASGSYSDSYYNRLVKVAYGKDAHDVVTVAQLPELALKSGESNLVLGTTKNADSVTNKTEYTLSLSKTLSVTSVTAGNTVINNTGLTVGGNTYVSNSGLNANSKKITNVAAGTAATDAVNYSQLQALNTSLTNQINNINTEITNLNTRIDNLSITNKGDGNIKIDGADQSTKSFGDSSSSGGSTSGSTSTGTSDNITFDFSLNPTLNVGDDTADGKININSKDGDTTISIDSSTGTISGLTNTEWDDSKYQAGDYEGSSNAATEGQLNTVYTEAKKHTNVTVEGGKTATAGGDYVGDSIKLKVTDNDGQLTYDMKLSNTIKVGEAGKDGKDGEDGSITIINKDGTNTTITITKDGKPGVNGKDGETTTRIVYDNKEVATLEDGMKFVGDDGTVIKKKLNETLSIVGGESDSSKLSTNANVGVVNDNGTLKVELAKNIDLGSDGSVTTGDTVINNKGLTIGGNTYVTKEGVNANYQKITNVKAGDVTYNSTDAVNGSQLYETRQKLGQLDGRLNKAAAGAAALAALHPLDFDPDAKWDFAAGYGHYAGASSAALGAYYRPNEDLMFSVGAALGNGENMWNAGVSVKLGSGSSHVNTSKIAMAKEIKDLRKELEELKGALLDVNVGKKLDTSKFQLFPDVEENHWAYEYVSVLKGNGILLGYPDGEMKGERPMTRYEFAAMLYRAMLKGAKLSDRILAEFAPELERFTVDTIAQDENGTPTIERVRVAKPAEE